MGPSSVTAQTPVYGLKYIVEGEPLRDARPALEANAKTIEAALIAGGVAAPGAADLLQVSGRVTVLETAQAASEVTARATSTTGTAQAIPGGQFIAVTLTAPAAGTDPLGFWQGAASPAQPTRLKVPAGRGGKYNVTGVLSYAVTAAGQPRMGELRVNGVTVPGSGASSASPGSINHTWPLPVSTITLAAGDYLELITYTVTAASLANTAGQTCALQLHRIGNA